ncbi:hypothetical protein [Flavobacterium sp. 2]|uniref:hypothetical protein n=1 Tax=Flavobacterium sp. 2 TaxID=308053 RepID=UPI000C19A5C7|nr:hypothetical protein [Flavobacterium sp. 2]PIF71598.1 hypothetical protein CLU99_2373 [Flavobacterium sp. 2]
MKKIFLLGTLILFSVTLFSCTADEFETSVEKAEIKKTAIPANDTQATSEDGPDDDLVNIKPPKK